MDRIIPKKRWTPKRIAWISGTTIFVLLLAYVLLTVGGGSNLRIEASKLTISKVEFGDFQEFIAVTGTIVPIKTFYLDATQGGTVIQVFLEEGSYLNLGDRILQLDNTDLHLDVMYREAQLFEQMNNLRNTRLLMEQNTLTLRADLLEIDRQIREAKRKHQQCVKLKEKGLISQHEFEQAQDEYDYWNRKRELTLETQKQDSTLRAVQIEQLEASINRMQANLKIIRQKLENLVITAPIAGHLTSLNAEVGQLKAAGERLGQIDVLEGFKISANVDEYYISRISTGQEGEVKIAGKTYRVASSKVYPEVKDGRFQVDMEFIDTEPEGIRRGQSVQIRLALGELSQAVMLSRGGFYNDTGGNWAYVLDESGKFATKRKIRLGRYNTQVYEVLEGLEPGERVITSSYDTFGDFDKLTFKDR
jgi:HlyD family secretion protein